MTKLIAGPNCSVDATGLVVTNTAAALGYAKSDISASGILSGKVTFRITVNGAVNGGPGFGNAAETTYIGGSGNSGGVGQDGVIRYNTYSYLSNFSSGLVNGDVLDFALDIAVGWWVKRNAEAWNPFIGSANPATGVGSFAFPSGGGPWFVYTTSDVNATGYTLAPSSPVVSGYVPWLAAPVLRAPFNSNLLR